jgi:hypothetical protein
MADWANTGNNTGGALALRPFVFSDDGFDARGTEATTGPEDLDESDDDGSATPSNLADARV